MAAKKKTTTKTAAKNSASSSVTAAKTSRPKKELADKKIDEIVPSMSSLGTAFRKMGKIKWVVFALLIAALILFLGNKYLVAAWVNNKPVTRLELNAALNQRYGKDLLEELIVEKLIEDEATKRNVAISAAELDAETKKVEDQQGGADKLNQVLQAQNISRPEFTKLVKLQLLRQKMFGSNANVSDDDVNKYIEDNKDSLDLSTKTASEQAKLKSDIKDQLKNQKINQDFNTWLTAALASSAVKRT